MSAPLLFLRAFNQVLAAGIGITALSLWFYALTFNLRNRVTLAYIVMLAALAATFGGRALGNAAQNPSLAAAWFRLQWLGIVFLPAAYVHFSDALLATTGKPSRGRRRATVWLAYAVAAIGAVGVLQGWLLGPFRATAPLPHYQATGWMWVFAGVYVLLMAWAWFHFVRAYRRTVVRASRRRMAYLLLGALAPTVGAFPYPAFLGSLTSGAPLFFWLLATLSNLITTVLLVLMAYAVAFFGAAWPDRVVRVRLFRWLLRGPVTVSTALALTTAVRRLGARYLHQPYTMLVPLTMVLSVLLLEHAIGATASLWEPLLGGWQNDPLLTNLYRLEERLFTRQDLEQFLEAVLAALCDQLQVPHAFIAAVEEGHLGLLVSVGGEVALPEKHAEALLDEVVGQGGLLRWDGYFLLPLRHPESEMLLGVLGFAAARVPRGEGRGLLHLLARRAALALAYYAGGQAAARALQGLQAGDDFIPRLRAVARYNQRQVLAAPEDLPPSAELAQWVKDALSHYWGGPRLSQNPLTGLQVVQQAMAEQDKDASQAVRSVLRDAVERLRPAGERRFTTEWLLYNILEMKFLQGHKVRDVAARLALSEASFYRKQRTAVEEVVRVLLEMEAQARARSTHSQLPDNQATTQPSNDATK